MPTTDPSVTRNARRRVFVPTPTLLPTFRVTEGIRATADPLSCTKREPEGDTYARQPLTHFPTTPLLPCPFRRQQEWVGLSPPMGLPCFYVARKLKLNLKLTYRD